MKPFESSVVGFTIYQVQIVEWKLHFRNHVEQNIDQMKELLKYSL